MSNVLETPAPTNPEPAETRPNRYTADAQERMAKLRAMAAEFPFQPDPRPLTRPEIVTARRTSVTALEKGALFAEAAPEINNGTLDTDNARDAIAFELAYGGVRDAALALPAGSTW